MRLVTLLARSSRPRMMRAPESRAVLRCLFQQPTEMMTLIMPVSSSRFMKVMPEAVAGRCRWVTTPATRTRVFAGAVRRSLARQDPVGGELVAEVFDGVFAGGDAGGPEVGDGEFVVAHPGQGGWWADGGDAGEPLRPLFGGASGFPECLAAAEAEAVEDSGCGECFDLRRGDPGTAYEVGHAGVGAVLVAFFHDGSARCRRWF